MMGMIRRNSSPRHDSWESTCRRSARTETTLLTLDRTETPPALHPHLAAVSELTGCIFVAHVMSRMEKSFVYDLIERDIAYYLPLAQRERFSGRKRYYTQEPVFPQYVFVASPKDTEDSAAETMARCMATRRVCRNIFVKNQLRMRLDLDNLSHALEVCPRIEQCPLVEGQQVRITDGPFMNLEGVVLERPSSSILVLRVGEIGYASIEIPRVMVEPA